MCNRRDFLVRGPGGVGYPTCIALCSQCVHIHTYIRTRIYRRPRSVGVGGGSVGGGAGVRRRSRGGGGGRGNGIELKVTDAPLRQPFPFHGCCNGLTVRCEAMMRAD